MESIASLDKWQRQAITGQSKQAWALVTDPSKRRYLKHEKGAWIGRWSVLEDGKARELVVRRTTDANNAPTRLGHMYERVGGVLTNKRAVNGQFYSWGKCAKLWVANVETNAPGAQEGRLLDVCLDGNKARLASGTSFVKCSKPPCFSPGTTTVVKMSQDVSETYELCISLLKGPPPSVGSGPGVNWGNGKAYFFSGTKYTRYDIASGKPDYKDPRPIVGNWGEKFWPTAPDAAIKWGEDDIVYFFKGDEYIKYDTKNDVPLADYPKKIAGNWPGWPGLWTDGIDAAVERD